MKVRASLQSVPWMLLVVLASAPAVVLAHDDGPPQGQSQPSQQKNEKAKTEIARGETEGARTEEAKLTSVQGKALGMSILGNQEAPKALVIVPWKQSEFGNAPDVSTMLDDSRQPVDKEVFMRMLSYYEIRSETASNNAAPAKTNSSQTAMAQRRK